MILNIAVFALTGALSAYLARKKGRNPTTWFILGFLFGLLGVLILYFTPNLKKKLEEEKEVKCESLPPSASIATHFFWYYLDKDHKQIGPISRNSFLENVKEGKISLNHYVWKEDMEEWKKLGELLKIQPDIEIQESMNLSE